METIQEKLEKLKQHTYTPNSFYDDLMDYIDGIEEHSGIVDGFMTTVDGFMTTVNEYMGDNNDVIAHLLALVSGDLNIVIDVPPLVDVSLTDMNAGTETQEITIKMQDSDEIVHETFNGALAVSFATSANGVVGDDQGSPITTVTFVKGVATFTAYYSGVWANDETVTLTVGTGGSHLGFALTPGVLQILSVESGA